MDGRVNSRSARVYWKIETYGSGAIATGTGAAGIQTTYGYNDPDSVNDVYNFTIKGLSFNKQTEEIVFDNGVNEYVCARIEHKRFVFKYKSLVETGICKIENKIYSIISNN